MGRSRDVMPSVEARLLVLSIMLEPPLALARIMGLSLDDLIQLVSDGYFREFRSRGMSLRTMVPRIGRSLRTLATMSKQQSDQSPLLSESQQLSLQRGIIVAVSQKPATVASLARKLRASAAEVEEEVARLSGLGIVDFDGKRVSIEVDHVSMVREDFDARLESLRHFLTAVSHVVYRRFFRSEPGAEAFARVFTFSATAEDLQALREEAYEALRDRVQSADRAGVEQQEPRQASVAFCAVETPRDPLW